VENEKRGQEEQGRHDKEEGLLSIEELYGDKIA
jgi:hypothetical protein